MVMDVSVSCFSCIALYHLFYTVYVEAINEYEMHNLDASFDTPLPLSEYLQSRYHSVVLNSQIEHDYFVLRLFVPVSCDERTVMSHAVVVEMTSRCETLRPTSYSATARTS